MNTQTFAQDWIDAWNSHDMDKILSHYTEDIEITTPMIRIATGVDSDSLKGKPLVAEYWSKALERIPDLHFKLIDVANGVDSVALYYESVMNKKAIEVMFLNAEGKVYKMMAHYH
ncbi:MAG: nuclear transport factor 2 family protein [Bacteroidetes bacterium]|nr:nuclear transport factor 2 family protein [Bacteroidota bacterium]